MGKLVHESQDDILMDPNSALLHEYDKNLYYCMLKMRFYVTYRFKNIYYPSVAKLHLIGDS